MPRWLLALFLILAAVGPARADPPIPALTGRVVDLAGVLDAATVAALTQRLADEEAATGNQIVVVTLPDLKGYAIEDWGLALLNGWGIGRRDKNNGVVLVVAPNDRRLRIEVGEGLERALSNGAAADIIQNEIVPRLKRGDMKGGILAGVEAIRTTLSGTYKGPPVEAVVGTGGAPGFERYLPFIGFPLLFFVIVGVRLVFGRSPARRAGPFYRNRVGGGGWYAGGRDQWHPRGGGSGGSSGGFSGGGGSGRGGGASGRW